MPGGGKSTVGRQLARRLDWPFVDADAVVESRLGESIRTHFERAGEDSFRRHEEAVIDELTRDGGPRVIATGGGACLRASNRRALHDRCTVVYLRSTPEELFRRLRHDTQRPLLQVGDPMARLKELFAQRDALYRECAHFVVETGRPSVNTLVNMVLMQLELAGLLPSDIACSPVDPPRR